MNTASRIFSYLLDHNLPLPDAEGVVKLASSDAELFLAYVVQFATLGFGVTTSLSNALPDLWTCEMSHPGLAADLAECLDEELIPPSSVGQNNAESCQVGKLTLKWVEYLPGLFLRYVTLHRQTWYLVADVCRAIKIGDPGQAAKRVGPAYKARLDVGYRGHEPWFVVGDGVSQLILDSRKAEAQPFRQQIMAQSMAHRLPRSEVSPTVGRLIAADDRRGEADNEAVFQVAVKAR